MRIGSGRGFRHLVIIPLLLWHCYVYIIMHQHKWCVRVDLKLSIPFSFAFPPPSVPQSFLGAVSIRGHSQWGIFCAYVLLFLMHSVQSAVSWYLTEVQSWALPHFTRGNTEAESLGSGESYAVNAVNQIRMERMLFSKLSGFSVLC